MAIRVLYDISVLGVGTSCATGRTGIYRVVEYVAEGLLQSSEVELFFCSSQGLVQHAPNTIKGCRKYIAEHPNMSKVPFFEADYPAVDIFHSPFYPLPIEIAAPARILTIYDLIPSLFPQFIPKESTQLQKLALHLLKPSDHLISISSATNSDLCRLTKVETERTHVTHLAADSNIFFPCYDKEKLHEIRKKYGIDKVPYILSLCTLEPRKNIDLVIRAYARLLREGRIGETRLVLVGTKGWDFGKIFEEIQADPRLTSNIITTGYVPDEDLSPLYSGAAVFVYMSIYEGFGLPPLEAMQCGIPVITSNTSSLPEVMGDAGIMLDPTDMDGLCMVLHQVLSDPELRREMSQRSVDQASKFSWDKCVQQTVKVYKKAVNMKDPIEITSSEPAIAIDGVIFQLQRGKPFGISRHWVSLLNELAKTPLAAQVVLLDRDGTAPVIPGIRQRRIPAFRLGTAKSEATLLDEICREEGGHLFLSTYYTYTLAVDSLLTLYDFIPERANRVGPDAADPEWRDKFNAINNSAAFVAISQSTARDFASYYPESAKLPLTVIPCAGSTEFRPRPQDEIAAFKATAGITKPYFIMVGRRDAHKNHQLFFHAFRQLGLRQRYAVILAGGQPHLDSEMERNFGGADIYAGFISDRELSIAYSGAIALVYPSVYEGFGLPILEAMQSGCPVITCRNSSIPEVAGSAALYVGQNDVEGMARALMEVQKSDVRCHFADSGLRQAQRFSWKKSAGLLSETIRDYFAQNHHAKADNDVTNDLFQHKG